MKKLNKMSKKELVKLCAEQNIDHKAKATKDELVKLILAAVTTPRKPRMSAKNIVREMFPKVGTKLPVVDVITHVAETANVAPQTVTTMIGDLKNPKYAAGPVMLLQKEGDNYVRKV